VEVVACMDVGALTEEQLKSSDTIASNSLEFMCGALDLASIIPDMEI
jgi:hypothetical protein